MTMTNTRMVFFLLSLFRLKLFWKDFHSLFQINYFINHMFHALFPIFFWWPRTLATDTGIIPITIIQCASSSHHQCQKEEDEERPMHCIKSLLLLIMTVMDNKTTMITTRMRVSMNTIARSTLKNWERIYVNLVHKNYWLGRRRMHPLPQHIYPKLHRMYKINGKR